METDNEPTTDVYAVLGSVLTIKIMESTGRFGFIVGRDTDALVFFDTGGSQRNYTIPKDWSLKQLMGWITRFYSEESHEEGVQTAKRKIRYAIGLD